MYVRVMQRRVELAGGRCCRREHGWGLGSAHQVCLDGDAFKEDL